MQVVLVLREREQYRMKKGAALRRGTTPVQAYIVGRYLAVTAEACLYFERSKVTCPPKTSPVD